MAIPGGLAGLMLSAIAVFSSDSVARGKVVKG